MFAAPCPSCNGDGLSFHSRRRGYTYMNDPRREDCRRCDGDGEIGAECAACGWSAVSVTGRCARCGAQHCVPCHVEDGLVRLASVGVLCRVCVEQADAELHGGGALVSA